MGAVRVAPRRGLLHAGRSVTLSFILVAILFLAGCTGPSEGGVVGGGGPGMPPAAEDDGLPYEVLPYRTPRDEEARFDVPTWHVGDVWEYEVEPAGWQDECVATDPRTPRSHDEVVGEGPREETGAEVYRVRITSIGCQGETQSYQDYDYLKDHLTAMDEQGRWLPKLVFPLEDGRRWTFTAPGDVRVTAESTWLPDHDHDGEPTTAWRIDLGYDRADGASETYWFGEAVRNLLQQEIHRDADGDGETELRVQKTLVAHHPADPEGPAEPADDEA